MTYYNVSRPCINTKTNIIVSRKRLVALNLNLMYDFFKVTPLQKLINTAY